MLLVLITATLHPRTAYAQNAPIYTPAFSNIALEGYDTVAYFTTKSPIKGSERFKTLYRGAEFRFASSENLARFKADPAAYAPQYGGYCAWAVSNGYTAKGDPKYWRVVGGKLYLNYNADIQAKWSKDIPGHIKSADSHWPKVLIK
jgi:YHS domain-containing protein